MKAHIFQHVPFETEAAIGDWALGRGLTVSRTRYFAGEAPPEMEAVDLLVVMGGPMSVNEEAVYPWLTAEMTFVEQAIRAGKPVLGVCLGAQMIAKVLGGRVYPNAEREIGWFPVHGEPASGPGALNLPERFDAFHWHGETFDLPAGAVRLARSEACLNQAFQYGPRAIGLQFHLETTPTSAHALIEHARADLRPGRYVQTEADLLAAPPARYAALAPVLDRVLAFLTAR